ncbi:hydantoinase/oxoprolinase family protein [Azotosporobacter soli]|uniref:hydantoinase/oxoprolinase family protein n=1 Tax=Azotosporobacter soli TaxID=3055040 RepID=UPI0031FF3972
MLLGIDVGGTFTDAVAVADGRVLETVKVPTTHDDLLVGILAALDHIVSRCPRQISRVALSTTWVTNAVVEGKLDPVELLVMAGPGLNLSGLLPVTPRFLTGYVDHRGIQVQAPDDGELQQRIPKTADSVYAVSGKFSVRNPDAEQQLNAWLKEHRQAEHVTLGGKLSGSLNFLRRTNGAYFNAAVWRRFKDFEAAINQALAARDIIAPLVILKADGGTMPLTAAGEMPVEAIFTGPAASVMGIQALTDCRGTMVSLDVGGTTTDLALWQDGQPLLAAGGAFVERYPTAVRAFQLLSVGVGGDSEVRLAGEEVVVGPLRRGPAMANGGTVPTLSDAMIVLEEASFGSRKLAEAAMDQLALPGLTVREKAETVLQAAARQVVVAIRQMLLREETKPVYRVAEITQPVILDLQGVIGVGGAAAPIAKRAAALLGAACVLPEHGEVANAIGAAVSRPTLEINLRADTVAGRYSVGELGLEAALPVGVRTVAAVTDFAKQLLCQRATELKMEQGESEVVSLESFPVVKGFNRSGWIYQCRMQLTPGVLMRLEEA